jgi:hypothetical protein
MSARILGEDLLDRRRVEVIDGRAAPAGPSLENEGFELAHWPCDIVTNHLQELMDNMSDMMPLQTSPVHEAYWDETVPLIRKLSGARDVLAMRSSCVRYSPATGRQKVMTPAGWAHLDYETDEAEAQLEQTLELHDFAPAPYSRFVLYQGWRVLSPPPQDFPLAICNGNTVCAADIVPIDYHSRTAKGDFTYRSCGARYNGDHEWWYFPAMTLDEMIVFKGYDSALADRFKTLHVSFEDTSATAPVPRISVESRYFALFD